MPKRPPSTSRRRPRRLTLSTRGRSGAMIAALTAGVLAGSGSAALAATPQHHPAPTRKPAPLTGAAKIDQESSQASKKAAATGKPVTVSALTTPTSTTVADPAGTFTLTQHAAPVRTWRDGAWKNLDATLRRNTDGSISPKVTTGDLVLSGGGSGPLATMTATGHTLSLSWPTTLPAPTLSGASATYPSVMDGVDLVVTAAPDGGFSDTLVVKTKAAAANPQLAHLAMATHSNDLTITADAGGDLDAAETAHGAPVFTASAPMMWDSATTTHQTGKAAPTRSSATAPGRGAHTAPIKTTATTAAAKARRAAGSGAARDGSITLTPDSGLLNGDSTVFPVYIDPTWTTQHAGSSRKAWAQVDTINKSAHHWEPSTLQNGYCGWSTCVPTFTARSYVRMSVPSQLQDATIYSSEFDLTVDYGPYSSCSSAPNPGLQLWWTGGISSSTTWNNGPTWHEKIQTQTPAACSGQNVGFSTTSFMQAHAQGHSTLTFGLKASSETNKDAWKQIHASTITMSTTYDRAPTLPSHPATSPGGPCQTGSPSAVIIGNDDVTFQTVASDPDGNQLGTQFVITNYGGSTVYDSGDAKTASTALTSTSGKVTSLTIPRTTIQGWHTDGATTAYQYSWWTRTSDGKLYSPTTGTGSPGTHCHFTYDPTKPHSPGVSIATTNGDAGALGDSATITLAPCKEVLADSSATCTGTPPNRYTYQINSSPPQSVTATGTTQTVLIPLHHVGPNTLTVFSVSSGGNPGPPAATVVFNVTGPAIPYTDGDINGDGNPDVLAAGTGTNPGLWLATGNGSGGLDTPTDIGAAGTGTAIPGSPADWSGTQILHGDFTGHHVQDVIAYHPPGSSSYAGGASLLYGNGDDLPLNPFSGSQKNLPPSHFTDYSLNELDGDTPIDLVAAGDVNLSDTANVKDIADLIGISGEDNAGYQLDLYITCHGCSADSYHYQQILAAPGDSPDGNSDWNNFALAAAQPGGQAVLFALKKTTGEIWESTNPTQDNTKLIGTPGTWTQLTAPWSTAPTLISGDATSTGAVQLWAQNGTTLTPYTLSDTALTQGTATNLIAPTHEWPLTSSSPTNCTSAPCTTPDTRGGTDIPTTGGVTFPTDDVRGTVADLDGKTGYLTLPDNLLHASNTLTLKLSFRADPGTDGILFSTGNDTPDAADPSAMPVMYIGTDGRLYAQFWNGEVRPMISPQPVNDGQWHTATLNAYDAGGGAYHQGLYLDDDPRIGMAGHDPVKNEDPLNYVGAGVFSHDTSTKTWINAPGTTTQDRASYFSGQISDVSYYNYYVTTAQLDAWWNPQPITGPIISGVSSAQCIHDDGTRTTNGNPIMIWTCENWPAQNWTITPHGTGNTISITLGGVTKCMQVAGNGTASGTLVQLYDCDGGAGEDWHLDSNGQIWNPNSNDCLDDPQASTTNGTQLQVYGCNRTNAQSWTTP